MKKSSCDIKDCNMDLWSLELLSKFFLYNKIYKIFENNV